MNFEFQNGPRPTIEQLLSWQLRCMLEAALIETRSSVLWVEVELSRSGWPEDDNGSACQHRCAVEVSLTGCQPFTLMHHADNESAAINGATEKLVQLIGWALGERGRAAAECSGFAEPGRAT